MARPMSIHPSVGQQYAPGSSRDKALPGASTGVDTPTTNLQAVDTPPAPQRAAMRVAPTPPKAVRLNWTLQLKLAFSRHAVHALLSMISIGALLGLWYVATAYRLDFYIRFNNIPTPAEVFHNGFELASSSRFQTNIWMSMRRILAGFSVATVLGIALGLICGRFKYAKSLIFPAMEVLRPIPAIAWVPMSIMLWPTTEGSIVFITFIGSFFPILINTIHGVNGVDPVLVRAAKSLGASEFTVMTRVVLRAAMPSIFTGLAVGMGVAWVSLIAAEMISGQFGVGYFTWEAYSLIEYPNIVLGMIVIGVLGLFCSGTILMIGRWMMPWRSLSQHGGDK